VQRAIVGFERDRERDWVVLLECGHRRHVRHRPPWQDRPWMLTDVGRRGRLGTTLACLLCDQADVPDAPEQAEGGDPACWAREVCPQCGRLHDGACPVAADPGP